MNNGYIKLHRSLVDWEWYQDANTSRVFLHLLLTSSYEQSKFMGFDIAPGERAGSYAGLAKELKLTVKNIRTSLEHLKNTGEVASRVAHKGQAQFSIFTIKNWAKYQEDGKRVATSQAVSRQAGGKRVATLKEGKEDKEREEEEYTPYIPQGTMRDLKKDFEDFWQVYPRKTGKGYAQECFMRLMAKTKDKEQLMNEIGSGLGRAINSHQWAKEKGRYIPNPSTFLNQKRWLDDYKPKDYTVLSGELSIKQQFELYEKAEAMNGL